MMLRCRSPLATASAVVGAWMALMAADAGAAFTYSTQLVYRGSPMTTVAFGTGSNQVGGANTIYSVTGQATTALPTSGGMIAVGSQTYTPQPTNTGTFIDTRPGGTNSLSIVITVTNTDTMTSGTLTIGDNISGTIGGIGPPTGPGSGPTFDPYFGSLVSNSVFINAGGVTTSTPPVLVLDSYTFTIPTTNTFISLLSAVNGTGSLTSPVNAPLMLSLQVTPAASVPEPSSLFLMGVGMGGTFAGARRRRAARSAV